MRLVNYLNESRTRPLDRGQVKYLLKNEFSDMAKNLLKGEVLYRGMRTRSDYSLLDPSKFETRQSANTSNHYTLFINNHPMWKNYPKREIICSTDDGNASDYGDTHLILPENGAKIGICPTGDIWNSFDIPARKYNLTGVDDLNSDLAREYNISDESYSKMKQEAENKYFGIDSPFTLWEVMEDIIDPQKNGFEVVTTKNLRLPGEKEVWTDAKCLVVNEDKDEELDDMIREIYGR